MLKNHKLMNGNEAGLRSTVEGLLSDMDIILFHSIILPLSLKIEFINSAKKKIHSVSPFNSEPVDCIQWIRTDEIVANDYNPNKVAPPEMKLLEISIEEDGFTQPIVSWKNNGLHEVVDGFHRNRVGRGNDKIKKRLHGFLPLTTINVSRLDRGDRIAATIRHNRARGKHQIESMSEIVLELKRRNWSKEKIGRELGMDPDEVLRLSQITGLAEMFADKEFSEAWEAEGIDEENNVLSLSCFDENDEKDKDYCHATNPDNNRREGRTGWEDRTDGRSVLLGDKGQTIARLNRQPDNKRWRWTIYSSPMQEGVAGTREQGKSVVDGKVSCE